MKGLFAGIVVTCGLTVAAGAAGVCATKAELKALQVSALQQQLVTAALSCHDAADFNQYVTRFRGDILKYDRALKAFFDRIGGEGYDTYKTRIAQEMSLRSLHDPHFCATAKTIFDYALQRGTETAGDTSPMLHPIVTGYETCGSEEPVTASNRRPQPLASAASAPVPLPKPRPATRVAVAAPPAARIPVPAARPLAEPSEDVPSGPLAAPVPRVTESSLPPVGRHAEPAPVATRVAAAPRREGLASREPMPAWNEADDQADAAAAAEAQGEPMDEAADEPAASAIAAPSPPYLRERPPRPRPGWTRRPYAGDWQDGSGDGPRSYDVARARTARGAYIPYAYRPGSYWVDDDGVPVRYWRPPPHRRVPVRWVRGPYGRWYWYRPDD